MPPDNDVDVFTQDLGFIAIVDGGELQGFNVTVGGGMGRTDGEHATYPRLADVIGFCRPEQVLAIAEAVVTIQRDFGDRADRRHARFKYTIDDRGLGWLKEELARRTGFALEPPRPFLHDQRRSLWLGAGRDGSWHFCCSLRTGGSGTPTHCR